MEDEASPPLQCWPEVAPQVLDTSNMPDARVNNNVRMNWSPRAATHAGKTMMPRAVVAHDDKSAGQKRNATRIGQKSGRRHTTCSRMMPHAWANICVGNVRRKCCSKAMPRTLAIKRCHEGVSNKSDAARALVKQVKPRALAAKI